MMKNVHVGWGPVGFFRANTSTANKLTLNYTRVSAELDQNVLLSITSDYEGVPVWTSSNEQVAVVDQNGNVTVVGYGRAIITVALGDIKGSCVIVATEPVEEEPTPETKLDNTKIYYGIVKNPNLASYSELTEDDITTSVEMGIINTSDLKEFEGGITITEPGDLVAILIPSSKFSAKIKEIDGSEHGFVDAVTGTNFHANGEIKLGDFYIFGVWSLTPGLLTIHVQ